MSDDRLPAAAPERVPAPSRGADVADAPDVAGGLGALVSVTSELWRHTGLVRGSRALLAMNQKKGFDCPGCAWPDPDDRSMFEFCENGAKALAEEQTRARADREFFAHHAVDELARWNDHQLGHAGRITEPMLLDEGASHYVPIAWDDALGMVADHLHDLDDPNQAVFYTSGRTSNEAAFLYQLLVRRLGTNNLPDCSNMCHESSGTGMGEVVGVGKGTVTLEDFDKTDCIVIIGQNPGTNHPRMLTTLQEASKRGCRIISINPLAEAGLSRFKHPQEPWTWLGRGTAIAGRHVPVRVGGDVALLNGVTKAMIERAGRDGRRDLDSAFIDSRTLGFDAFRDHVLGLTWAEIEQGAGVARTEIEALADELLASERMIVCWAMGLTQHEHGVANIQCVINLLMLGGHLGREGAGACPVRGHSNVQGDRTMGIWERPTDEFLDALQARFDFAPPREHGVDVVGAIEAMRDGQAKVFFAMGGNFLSAAPDTDVTAQALRSCELTVHVSTKLNRSHLVHGRRALILPCLARSERDVRAGGEQFVTVENSMGYVHPSRGTLSPVSQHLESEVGIVARLGAKLWPMDDRVDWASYADDYSRVRADIQAVVPGFDDFERRVGEGGFLLPNVVREGGFGTPSGRGHFTAHPLPRLDLREGELVLMTMRSHDQYNTTVYGMDDRYRGVHGGRHVVFVHPDDAAERGLQRGDVVDVISRHGEVRRVAERFQVVPYDIPRGCAAAYFPEANVLVPVDSYAKGSRTPTSKSIPVVLRARG